MSFERDLQDQLQKLARPRTPQPGALETIAKRVRARRRFRISVLAGAVVLVLAAISAAVVALPRPSVGPVGQNRVSPDVSVSPAGVFLNFTVAFDETRTLNEGAVRNQGRMFKVGFSPDGDDSGSPLPSSTVRPGQKVLAGAAVLPDCRRDDMGSVMLSVVSRRDDGTRVTDRYTATNAADLDAAAARWCASGLQMGGVSTAEYPDGRFIWTTELINPGPEPITVRSPDYTLGDGHWRAMYLVVPARRTVELNLRGSNVDCGENAPWVTGSLTADDVPVKWDLLDDGCG